MKRCLSLMVSLAVASTWLLGGGVLPANAQTEIALTVENNRFQPEEIKVKARPRSCW